MPDESKKILNKSPEKISSMFDEIASKYDFLNHFFTLNIDKIWRSRIRENLELFDFKKLIILDLAAGTGDLTKELMKLNLDMIYACDISDNMLEILSKKIKSSKVRTVNSTAEELPFTDNAFDVVTVGFGVRNFYNLETSLKEIYRVLDNGGLLVVLDFFKSDTFKAKLFNLYSGKIIPAIGNFLSNSKTKAYSYLNESIENFLTVEEFISLTKKLGFHHIKTENNLFEVVNTVYLKK